MNIEDNTNELRQCPQFELYRRSTIGITLCESLDELVNNNSITSELAERVLKQFDISINQAISENVKNKITFKGHLHTYRFCENVWTLILENAKFKLDREYISTDKVKIVACDASLFK